MDGLRPIDCTIRVEEAGIWKNGGKAVKVEPLFKVNLKIFYLAIRRETLPVNCVIAAKRVIDKHVLLVEDCCIDVLRSIFQPLYRLGAVPLRLFIYECSGDIGQKNEKQRILGHL